MAGPVEWAVLIFVCFLMLGSLGIAWRARGVLSDLQIQIAVKFSEFEKDIRHMKRNVEQHSVIGADFQKEQISLRKDVDRIAKLVNGK